MIFQTLNRNSIIALALMPLLLIGFWMNSFIAVQSPSFPFDQSPMPLWSMVLSVLKGNHFLSSLISMLIALVMMFGVNRVVNKYSLNTGQTTAPGFLFLLLVSAYLMVQKLHPVWFFSPLLLLSVERLFSAYGNRKPMAWCFESTFWLSVGALFFAKGIYFLIFLWMVMFILRLFSLRAILASILGAILPFVLAMGYYYLVGELGWFLDLMIENFISPVAFFSHTIFSQMYNGFIIFLIFISILVVVRILPTLKIISRKHYRIFIWLIVFGVIAALTPYYSLEVVPIMAIGASIVLSRFLNAIRRTFIQDIIIVLLFGGTIAAQFLI